MGIEEIPRSYKYLCDGPDCKEFHLQHNASSHYTSSRPPHWVKLKLEQDACDYQGMPVADGSITLLLCPQCAGLARKALAKITGEAA